MQFSISLHATILSKRNQFASLSTPGSMLFWLNSPSVHRKQHCNRRGEKRSFNLRLIMKAFLSCLSAKIGIFVMCLKWFCPRLKVFVCFDSALFNFVDGSKIHLVDFYDAHINDIWLLQNKYLDP